MFVASVPQVISTGTKSLRPREEIALHRSEGFGRGMAEALQLGLDVIATAHGGNTDFGRHPRPPRSPMVTCGGSLISTTPLR